MLFRMESWQPEVTATPSFAEAPEDALEDAPGLPAAHRPEPAEEAPNALGFAHREPALWEAVMALWRSLDDVYMPTPTSTFLRL